MSTYGRPDKRIIFDFVGGPWDGRQLDSESKGKDRYLFEMMWDMTCGGEIGKAAHGWSVPAMYAVDEQKQSVTDLLAGRNPRIEYVVSEWEETDELVTIKVIFDYKVDEWR